ncbi:VanZ family protein [Microbacterium sp. LWH12-1.2]|uniref:VanZ family protein n=1 Tax=Microbacterium sp. LWH12-1.2 TaxID=3135259 RepID=UPI00344689F3
MTGGTHHPGPLSPSKLPVLRDGTLARVLLVPYLIALLLITWLPEGDAAKVTGIVATLAAWLEPLGVPFALGYPALEFIANVALFIPFGLLSALAWRTVPLWWITVAGFSVSCVIELVQFMLPTRFPTISDVVANTLGAVIGCCAARLIPRLHKGLALRWRNE